MSIQSEQSAILKTALSLARARSIPSKTSTIMKTIPQSTAATRVFATAELLEAIMLEVLGSEVIDCAGRHDNRASGYEERVECAKTVLHMQRVNKTFQSCILGSPALRRQLGLATRVGTQRAISVNTLMLKPYRWIAPWRSPIPINGLEHFCLFNNDKGVAVSFEITDRRRLQDTLRNSPASWLKLWVSCPMPEHIRLSIGSCHRDAKTGADLYWWQMEIKVKAEILGVLLDLAMSLKGAAEELERVKSRQEDFRIKKGRWEDDWKKWFTAQQLEMIVEGPAVRVIEVRAPLSVCKIHIKTFQYCTTSYTYTSSRLVTIIEAAMSSTTSAVAKVFTTAELLEAILLEADFQTALVARRVNGYFQACIKGSSKLQEKLFFKLRPAKTAIDWHKDEPEYNPLLLRQNCAAEGDRMKHYQSPYLELQGLFGGFYLSRCKKEGEDEVLQVVFDDFDLCALRHTLATQQPTFLDMYLCQTTTSKIQVCVQNLSQMTFMSCFDTTNWDIVHAQAQIGTFGQLLKLAMSMHGAARKLAQSEVEKQSEAHHLCVCGNINEAFDWKNHFTRQQLDMLEEDPKFLLN
ncbi:hypothetical protein AC579_7622 [Pseudocercospora musae]|uniref:Uncharacterized protein n=1 Tax=Pseudocercospora musae TaxID=113226 RepID=A0A139GUX8_9PEZI|nr:hypothetical protein AC579_7622 [Pseudocercospora musae]